MVEIFKDPKEFMTRLLQAKRIGGGGLASVGIIQCPQNPGFKTGFTALLRSGSA